VDLLTVYQNSNYDASDGDYFDIKTSFRVDFMERQKWTDTRVERRAKKDAGK